ncbi:uncharacterized protein LOC119169112 isoform X5 [Rhipicephalus microplus]|uniref:uncharacterized protein LOC119169112 isoform X5 n=1 Tax=Rhipicephalus microplus TaxID=6941 RepID=UPI003F6D2EBC
MATNIAQPGSSTPSSSTPGVLRLREPKVFSGADETEVEDWFTHYQLVHERLTKLHGL